MGEKTIRVGLIGFGTIGTGVVKLLQRNRAAIRDKLGVGSTWCASPTSTPTRDRGVKLGRGVLVPDARVVLDDPAIDIVIELMGGTGAARRFVLEAIDRQEGRRHRQQGAARAPRRRDLPRPRAALRVDIGFEASVGGGIPIIRVLKEGLCGDRNLAVYGIVNGTSNYILSRMSAEGGEFADVLRGGAGGRAGRGRPVVRRRRHRRGAQADAADPARASARACRSTHIPVEGHPPRQPGRHRLRARVRLRDQVARRRQARRRPHRGGGAPDHGAAPPSARRRQRRAQRHRRAGRGAGREHVSRRRRRHDADRDRGRRRSDGDRAQPAARQPRPRARRSAIRCAARRGRAWSALDDLHSEYYLRFMVVDRPGVLARIAGILGSNEISIAAVIQREREHGRVVPVVIRTHDARETRAAARGARDRPAQRRARPLDRDPHRGKPVADGEPRSAGRQRAQPRCPRCGPRDRRGAGQARAVRDRCNRRVVAMTAWRPSQAVEKATAGHYTAGECRRTDAGGGVVGRRWIGIWLSKRCG